MTNKKVLIVSDNQIILKGFVEIIDSLQNFGNIHWEYAVSPYSNQKQFQETIQREVGIFDMKKGKDIQQLLNYNLIFSIHCKQLFPKELFSKVKCINVHPGFNPVNRGWYPQVFAIIHERIIGATIHEINENLDDGPVIARAEVEKKETDTSLDLYNRVVNKELELIKLHIKDILTDNYQTFIPEEQAFLFLKKDFNNLLEIDIEKKYTGKEFVNLLRALSHAPYKNAFYISPETGKKIYMSIQLEEEK